MEDHDLGGPRVASRRREPAGVSSVSAAQALPEPLKGRKRRKISHQFALLVAVVAAALSSGRGGIGVAAYGVTVLQARTALQEATEKLEFDEDKLQKARDNLALDQQNVQDDIHAINHPLAVGMVNTEGVMNKGKIDTLKLMADRPGIPIFEAIVEEDKKALVGRQLDYERALKNAPPPPAPPPPPMPLPRPDTPLPPSSRGSPGQQGQQGQQGQPGSAKNGAPGRSQGSDQPGGQGGAGGAGNAHFDDSPYYPSRHWSSCPPCSNGTPQEIAEWLETTPEGMQWIQSQEGLDWLMSPRGADWLVTPQGAEWPFTRPGDTFFTSDWGRKFLESQAGQSWLRTPPGLRWLREHKPWASSILRLRNAAMASLVAVLVAGLLSVYVTPKKVGSSFDSPYTPVY
jgi:hypothetical protein